MMPGLVVSVGLLYFLISASLFAFGVNFLYLAWLAVRRGGPTEPAPPPPATWPAVTVQLPVYNELYVAERLVQAVARLDYPAHRLHIQVLDDSTDETSALLQQVIDPLRDQGVAIEHLRRPDRTGFKAGALQAGLDTARGDYIAIFDADFLPAPDFLQRIVPWIAADPGVAFVQARWGHLNRDYSWLTRLQALAIDAHFMVEQFARSRAGYWFNFNGTAGIWRRAALIDAGGWTADTLTEDLDISYRAYLRGWSGRFAREIVAPAELPASFSAFRRQQHRWARGSLECARKLGPRVWRAPLPLQIKLQATHHLLGYSVHILLFLLTLLYPLVVWLTDGQAPVGSLWGLAALFGLTSLAPTILFAVGQQQQGRRWARQLPAILAVSLVGSGLMLNTVRAALQIWRRPQGIFERTAKFGIMQGRPDWTRRRYQLPLDGIAFVELALGAFNLVTAVWALQTGSWGIAFFAALFGSGMILAGGVTIVQATTIRLNERAHQRPSRVEQEWVRTGA